MPSLSTICGRGDAVLSTSHHPPPHLHASTTASTSASRPGLPPPNPKAPQPTLPNPTPPHVSTPVSTPGRAARTLISQLGMLIMKRVWSSLMHMSISATASVSVRSAFQCASNNELQNMPPYPCPPLSIFCIDAR